jgi:hypothetical protein
MQTETITATLIAAGPILQRRFVTFGGAQAGATDVVAGIATMDATAGVAFSAHMVGIAAVESGGAVAIGAPVIPDAQGRGIADTGTAANRCGRAMNAVTGAGQTLFVVLR